MQGDDSMKESPTPQSRKQQQQHTDLGDATAAAPDLARAPLDAIPGSNTNATGSHGDDNDKIPVDDDVVNAKDANPSHSSELAGSRSTSAATNANTPLQPPTAASGARNGSPSSSAASEKPNKDDGALSLSADPIRTSSSITTAEKEGSAAKESRTKSASKPNTLTFLENEHDSIEHSKGQDRPSSNAFIFGGTDNLADSSLKLRIFIQRRLPDFMNGTTARKAEVVHDIATEIRDSGERVWIRTGTTEYRAATATELHGSLFQAMLAEAERNKPPPAPAGSTTTAGANEDTALMMQQQLEVVGNASNDVAAGPAIQSGEHSSSVISPYTIPSKNLFIPRDVDVIFGRGEPTRIHPGNVRLRHFVAKWLEDYVTGHKNEKSVIIKRVMDALDATGARYLVPLDQSCRVAIFNNGCREATKAEVRSKVSHAFRDGERRLLFLQKKQKEEEELSKGNTVLKKEEEESPKGKVVKPKEEEEPKGIDVDTVMRADDDRTAEQNALAKGLLSLKPAVEKTKEATRNSFVTVTFIPAPRKKGDDPAHGSAPKPAPPTQAERPGIVVNVEPQHANPAVSVVEPPPPFRVGPPTTSNKVSNVVSDHSYDDASLLMMFKTQSTKAAPLPPPAAKPKRGRKPKKSEEPKPISAVVRNLEKLCRPVDVVFGRGAPLRQHPGNIKFRSTVGKYNERYGAASKHEKTEIISNVIKELQIYGAKFLIMEEDGSKVTEAEIDDIRMKVSHRFRDFTRGKSPSSKKRDMSDDEDANSETSKKKAKTSDPSPTTDNHAAPLPENATESVVLPGVNNADFVEV